MRTINFASAVAMAYRRVSVQKKHEYLNQFQDQCTSFYCSLDCSDVVPI